MIYSKEDIFKMIEDNAFVELFKRKNGEFRSDFIFMYYYNCPRGNINPVTKHPYPNQTEVIKVKDENGKDHFITSLSSLGFSCPQITKINYEGEKLKDFVKKGLKKLQKSFWEIIKDGWIKDKNYKIKIYHLEPLKTFHPDYKLVKDLVEAVK